MIQTGKFSVPPGETIGSFFEGSYDIVATSESGSDLKTLEEGSGRNLTYSATTRRPLPVSLEGGFTSTVLRALFPSLFFLPCECS